MDLNHDPMHSRHDYFDLQVNGFAGVDFQRADLTAVDLERVVTALERHATTGILWTLISDTIDSMAANFAAIERLRAANPRAAQIITGYHLEDPYRRACPKFISC